jgi:hypothetical protein
VYCVVEVRRRRRRWRRRLGLGPQVLGLLPPHDLVASWCQLPQPRGPRPQVLAPRNASTLLPSTPACPPPLPSRIHPHPLLPAASPFSDGPSLARRWLVRSRRTISLPLGASPLQPRGPRPQVLAPRNASAFLPPTLACPPPLPSLIHPHPLLPASPPFADGPSLARRWSVLRLAALLSPSTASVSPVAALHLHLAALSSVAALSSPSTASVSPVAALHLHLASLSSVPVAFPPSCGAFFPVNRCCFPRRCASLPSRRAFPLSPPSRCDFPPSRGAFFSVNRCWFLRRCASPPSRRAFLRCCAFSPSCGAFHSTCIYRIGFW